MAAEGGADGSTSGTNEPLAGGSTIRTSDLFSPENREAEGQSDPSERYEDTEKAPVFERATGFRKEVDATLDRYRLLATGEFHLNPPDLSSWGSPFDRAEPSVASASLLDTSKLNMPNFVQMMVFARERGRVVTNGLKEGGHNASSQHYPPHANAIDVRTWDGTRREINQFMIEAFSAGLTVRDERTWPKGQAKWDGPHIHLEVPSPNRPQRLLMSPAFYGTPPAGTRVKTVNPPPPPYEPKRQR